MATHIEVTRRAQFYFRPSGEHAGAFDLLKSDPDYDAFLQAGSFFPDWGYSCADQEVAAEEAHWPRFWNETVNYIREVYPQRPLTPKARALISFLMGVISHGVADAPWHSLDMEKGFIDAIQALHFRGDYGDAHSVADIGAEFVLAHAFKLQHFNTRWRIPTGDLVEIYKRINITVTPYEINRCMLLGYSATHGVRLIGRLLYPRWAAMAPYLVDNYVNHFRGGLNDMSAWVSTCWHDTLEWLEHGPQVAPMCKSMDKTHKRGKRPIHPEPEPAPDPGDDEDDEGDNLYKLLGENSTMTVQLIKYSRKFMKPATAKTMLSKIGANPRLQDEEDASATISMRFGFFYFCRVWLLNAIIPYFSLLGGESPSEIASAWIKTLTADDHMEEIDFHNSTRTPSISDHLKGWLKKTFPKLYQVTRITIATSREMLTEMGERVGMALNRWSKNRCKVVEDVGTSHIFTDVDFAGFGNSLVVGDFNGDGIPDLVIGSPGYTLASSSTPQTGAVFVIPGGASLRSISSIMIDNLKADVVSIYGDPLESASRFGSAMTVVDINGDGVDDLVVSAPWYNAVELFYDGRVYIFLGEKGVGIRPRGTERKSTFDAESGAHMIIYAPQRAPDHTPDQPYPFLFTALGSRLISADLDGDGMRDLIIGSPDADVGFRARRGLIHGFMSRDFGSKFRSSVNMTEPVAVNISQASWSTDSGELMRHEMFGAAIAIVPAVGNGTDPILLVGAPGWRDGLNGRAIGRLYGFDFDRALGRPQLRFTISGEDETDAFGSHIAAIGPFSTERALFAVSAPYEKSPSARSNFLDLPGILTGSKSHGRAAGSVRIFNVAKVPSGDSRLGATDGQNADGAVVSVLRGSRSDERGRVYVLPFEQMTAYPGDRTVGEWGHLLTHHAKSNSKASVSPKCMIGPQARSRLGMDVAMADLDGDGKVDIIVSAGGDGSGTGVEGGSGVVRIVWG
ncbi:integrin subunit alpha 8 [Dinochytrium kinnereticum]|nr:integrin subunit alpha 8 [Dinochytrium kinnereticum]